MRQVLASLALVSLCCASANPGAAQEADAPPTHPSFIALAMADGPTADDRIVLSFRGTSANAVVVDAVRACYERAAQGYMHTCQVSYGDAWVVGTICAQTPTTIKFAIGDDRASPEAAKAKAVTFLRDVEHADVSNCRVVAEYNADDMQVARSVTNDRR